MTLLTCSWKNSFYPSCTSLLFISAVEAEFCVCDTTICHMVRLWFPHSALAIPSARRSRTVSSTLSLISQKTVKNTHKVFCVSISQHDVFLAFCIRRVWIQTQEKNINGLHMVHFSASLNIFQVSNVIPKDFLRTKQPMQALTAALQRVGNTGKNPCHVSPPCLSALSAFLSFLLPSPPPSRTSPCIIIQYELSYCSLLLTSSPKQLCYQLSFTSCWPLGSDPLWVSLYKAQIKICSHI